MIECFIFIMLFSACLVLAFFIGLIFEKGTKDKRFDEVCSNSNMSEADIKKQQKINREYLNFMLYDGDEQDKI